MLDYVPTPVPMHAEGRIFTEDLGTAKRLRRDGWTFARVMGKLGWLRKTRLCILTALSHLAGAMKRPSEDSWARLVYLLRYLLGTRGHGLEYVQTSSGSREKGDEHVDVTVWSDANWVDKDYSGVEESVQEALKVRPQLPLTARGRSRRGLLLQVGNSYVYGQSKLMTMPFAHSTDAEYKALSASVTKGQELWHLVRELDLRPTNTMYAKVDAEGAINRGTKACMQKDARHMAVSCGIIAETVKSGQSALQQVTTQEMRADILTKVLGATVFHRLRVLIMCDTGLTSFKGDARKM